MDNWYIYVNRETMQICRVSPALEEDADCHLVMVDRDVGISFVSEPHLVNDYVVYYDGTKVHLVKKEKTSNFVVPFYYSPLMIESNVENPDVLVTIKNKVLSVSMRKELSTYAMTIYGNVDSDNQRVQFYISAKNDPNKLIEILHVNMMQVITKGQVDFEFDYDLADVSIFTRKIFDSYGLINIE